MYGYIYKTTNTKNGMIYIGQKKSSCFLSNKYLGSGKRLWEAIRKYGEDCFTVELIEEIASKEDMDKREIYWIEQYNATDINIGYNLSTGGNVNRRMVGVNNPFYGKHHSQETKERWKKSRKYKYGKDHPSFGKHLTDEQKEKISKANTGRIKTAEQIKKWRESRSGYKTSEETRKKISEANKKSKKTKGCYIHITNDLEDKTIHRDLFPMYEQQGWRRGRKKFSKIARENISKGHKNLPSKSIGRIWITDGQKCKTIYPEEFIVYEDKGWHKGRIINKK